MRKLMAVLAFLLSVVVPSAQAQDCVPFTDVPASHPFCSNMQWMYSRSITLGCTGTTYCPNDPVTRAQMAAFMNRLADSVFPLTCASGQVMKWNGTAWACANDVTGGGGGSVTSVAAGTGLQGSPNPITGAGALNLAPSYQLPQACSNGQVPKSNGSGGWTCGTDSNAGGTVTSVATGTGLTGGPITASGAIAADTNYLQRRVAGTCAAGSSIRTINADGTVVCEVDDGGTATAFVQGGNAFGTTATLGTTDGQRLAIQPAAGNVGIGTATPQSKFNVVGTSWFQGDSTPLPVAAGKGIGIGFGAAATSGYIFAYNYTTAQYQDLFMQHGGGRIGMGTTTPSAGKLHIESNSASGRAIYASTTSGEAVYGSTSAGNGITGVSSSALGVYARSNAAANGGILAEGAYIGAQGIAYGADVNRQGVRGEISAGAGGYAGLFFGGTTWVVGTLQKNAGAFRIDHPLDPENKYLQHSFVESPDMKNIYDGVVTTDGDGLAAVELPDYFEALNQEFRYQLTAIGQFAQAIIAQEIVQRRFVIRTDKPVVKVSWQVTGVRKDAYANAHRIQVEENKAPADRGRFIFPEGFGAGAERSVTAAMPSDLSAARSPAQ